MTGAILFRRDGLLEGVEVQGHAGFAPAGEDIVCAAISAITQTAVLGLTEVLALPARYQVDERKGLLRLELPQDAPDSARLILQVMEAGLHNIQRQYPDHIRITYRERR